MRRHGLRPMILTGPAAARRLRFEGWTIHLPLLAEGRYAEAERLARAALGAAPGPLWFSHLPAEEASALARQLGGAGGDPVPVRLRLGTRLWLGEIQPRRPRRRSRRASDPSRANGPAIGSAVPRPMAGSWWWPAARRTASAMEAPTPATHAATAGDRRRHRFAWRRPGLRSARTRSTARNAGSSSRRTCSPSLCSCRARSSRPPSATRSRSSCG